MVHGLPSTEIKDFLDENDDIIDDLELINLSEILNKLGIKVSSIEQFFDSNEKEKKEKEKQ